MFIIISGSDTVTRRLREAGVRPCPACLRDTPFSLQFQYRYSHLYYLFGMVTRREFVIQCDECGNTWTANDEDIGSARESKRTKIPFLRRWGCLGLMLGGVLVVAASFGLLVWLGQTLGEGTNRREQLRQEEFHRRLEDRVRKANEQGPKQPADAPEKD